MANVQSTYSAFACAARSGLRCSFGDFGLAQALGPGKRLFLWARGLLPSRAACSHALAIREKTLGPEHRDTATSLNSLGSVLLSDYPAVSRPLVERALAIREKALGPEHPDTAASLNNLACLLHDQSDFARARSLFERALAIQEKMFDPAHQNTNRTRTHLAQLLLTSGQPTEALALGEIALAAH